MLVHEFGQPSHLAVWSFWAPPVSSVGHSHRFLEGWGIAVLPCHSRDLDLVGKVRLSHGVINIATGRSLSFAAVAGIVATTAVRLRRPNSTRTGC